MKFYDRERELELLERLGEARPSFLVVTGRRRVGKTELIRRFIQGKDAIYLYVDANKSIEILMEEFGRDIAESLNLPEFVQIRSPESLLEFLTSYDRPLIVIFDEFQRFQKFHPSFISQVQRYWDMKGKQSHLFLIVSGSSVGMIRRIFLEGEAPLFRRADNIITLRPFRPADCLSILRDLGVQEPKEALDLYLLFGGTVYYYTFLEKYRCTTFIEAVDRLVLNDLAPLRREMSEVLIEEFGKEHATYYEIMAAIAEGKTAQKEIADFTRLPPTSLPPYFRDLTDLLGIVEYRTPVTEQNRPSKMGRYVLADNFFRFYAHFIYRNMSLYQGSRYEILTEKILREWRGFSGKAFEEMVRTLLRESLGARYQQIGQWWNRKGDEIDLLALCPGALAVEIKNRDLSEPEARAILTALQAKLPLVKGIEQPVTLGIAARTIEAKDSLQKDGYVIWDLGDLGLNAT
jgi:AAA+ ATPase superfamily predicted ATPase